MCFVMLGDAGQPLGFNSENRDAAHPATARRAAEKLDVLLRSDESFRVLASLGLATPFGPSLPKDLRPSPRAHDLALQEFHAAVPRLEELYRTLCITSLRGGNARVPWLIELPARESLLAELGFPILGAFSPNAAYDLYRLIPALKTPALAPQHPRFRQLLTEFVFAENEQWRFIGAAMPYSFRYRALSWAWSRKAHQTQWAYALCLKCGETLRRSRQPHLKTPLCAICVKESSQPPPHNSIAPITRGSWWLRCEDCNAAFKGSGQRRKCDKHDTSRLTISKRPRRTT